MNLARRAVEVCVTPRRAFLEVARERAGVGEIYRDYAGPLALLAPLAGVIASLRGGLGVLPRAALAGALHLGAALAGLYLVALAVNALAPLFGGTRDEDAAFRLVAFASTPAWLAALAAVVPGFGALGALALWSLVLIYVGLPRLMGCAEGLPRAAYAAAAGLAMALVALAAGQWLPPMPGRAA